MCSGKLYAQIDQLSQIELPAPPQVVNQTFIDDKLQFTVSGAQDDQAKIYFFDATNTIVFEEEMELNPNTAYYTIKNDKFPPGLYTVLIVSKYESYKSTFTLVL